MGEPVKILCDGVVADGQAEVFMVAYDADGKVMAIGRTAAEKCKSVMAARYLAVIQALEKGLSLLALADVPVELHINSHALVKQFTGKWPVKKKALLKLHQRAMAKLARYSNINAVFHGGNIAGEVAEMLKKEGEMA